MTYKPRIILFGTPEFAAISFRALLEIGLYDIPLIVTQPDRAVGRGLEIVNSPVKSLAIEKGIPVLQPKSLRGKSEESQNFIDVLKSLAPIDLFIVIAYGKIIPQNLLDIPAVCALNIHGSILPRWRGAAPVHRALASGDKTTGVGIMKLEEGLDTGPIFAESITNIYPEDDFLTLHDRLANLGRDLLIDTIPKILSKTLIAVEQKSEGVTYANKWEKEDLLIAWSDPAEVTVNRIRASSPFPGARTKLNGNLVKVFKAQKSDSRGSGPQSGTIVEINNDGAVIQLEGEERILIKELQLAGKKRLPVPEISRGRGIKVGDRFE